MLATKTQTSFKHIPWRLTPPSPTNKHLSEKSIVFRSVLCLGNPPRGTSLCNYGDTPPAQGETGMRYSNK